MRELSQFHHPNILTLRKDFHTQTSNDLRYLYLILDYCNGEDFHQYLRRKRNILPEAEAKYFMIQFARGLKFMRFHNISHRDLKPQNLLLQKQGNDLILKIADFGYAKVFETQDLSATHCGSPLYMAPEIHDRDLYSVKADLWSVGIILYQITCGQAPFAATSLQELTWKLKTQSITFPPTAVNRLSRECKDLILRLLEKSPHRRISWEDFFNHPWFGEPITLPEEMHSSIPVDPEFAAELENCLVVAKLADNLSSEHGRHGEMLTLYLKFLSEMKDLYRSMPDSPQAAKIFQQHYHMYLAKATQMAETTDPQGIPEKLIYAAFRQFATKGNDAEIHKQYDEAKSCYETASLYLSKLYRDAIHGSDKTKLARALESLQTRIAVVSSMIQS